MGKNARDVQDFNLLLPVEEQLARLLHRERDKRGRFVKRKRKASPLAAIRRRTGQSWGEHCAGALPRRKQGTSAGGV